jgi:integrase
MAREPGYCLHKPTGQAYVNLGGKVVYLGKHGTEESREAYGRVKAEWLVNRNSPQYSPNATGPTMADLCLAYLEHARSYYPTGNEYDNLKTCVKPISLFYATIPASQFSPVHFRTIRDWWIKSPIEFKRGRLAPDPEANAKPPKYRSRKTVNEQMNRLVRIIKWGVAQGMVPVTVHQTLKCIEPLKRGRSDAVETKPVRCVEQSLIDATVKQLTPVLSAMVRFQQLTGCRPGELIQITPAMVDRSGDVWTITLENHKTAYRGKSRTLYLGPKAQAILMPYLLRGANDPCFSPKESESQRLAMKHEKRVTPPSYGNRPGTNRTRKPKRQPGTQFTTGSYARAIKYACQRAELEHWHPNQLRHSAATAIRKEFGIDAASVILGHSSLDVTQVYAEKDEAKAKEVARRIG